MARSRERSIVSRTRFAWILIQRLTYQFAPNVKIAVGVAQNDLRARRVGRKAVGGTDPKRMRSTRSGQFHRAETALKERPPRRVEAIGFVLAGQRPRAADVIAARDERIQIGVVDALAQALVGQPDVLRLDRERSRAASALRSRCAAAGR